MAKMIFVNLPVTDLAAAKAFYEAIGAVNNPMFTDETAACMVISDEIYVMLLTYEKFRQFTTRDIADAHKVYQVLLTLTCDGRAGVDAITEAALAAGGREHHEPEDLGFMYSRAFEDPDGHGWGAVYMDMEAATAVMSAPAEPADA